MTFSILHPKKICCLAFLDETTAIVITTVEGKYFKKEVNVSLFRCQMSASRTAREKHMEK